MTQPNLLVITTDQQRWDWLGCHGSPGVDTPHLDALASRGVRFTRHVTNSTVCVPARIGLATGVSPIRLGTLSNGDVLPPGVPTYYQALRDAGYRVGVVGKLDLNKTNQQNGRKGNRPDTYTWGFTDPIEAEGKMHARGDGDGRPLGPYGWWLHEQGLFDAFRDDAAARSEGLYARWLRQPGDPPHRSTRWFDDSPLPAHAFEDAWIGRRSCQWLREVPDEHPWHLYVSFVGPHDPFDPPTEYAERFRDAPVPAPVLDSGAGRNAATRHTEYGNTEDEIVTARRQYTAALAVIDDAVGDLVATIDELGLTDDTIVIFSSDHGEMLGDHRLFQKHVPYEPAMRIPLLAAGPGIATGVSDALTELVDLAPTLLERAGVDPLADIDGQSLVPLLTDPTLSHRDAQVVGEHHYRAIRTHTHKYVHYVDPAFEWDELYDLDADPDETQNLIGDQQSLAAELRADLMSRIGEEAMTHG
ncbi:MAG: sulfatase-like hydrolase/transferase [Acidimicrobiia bacterium]|nr:sulfatase-like hydrolase/transferase [Acidimicrobiia bacterium]